MIDNYAGINSTLVEKWDANCRNNIISNPIELDEALLSYIKGFDFSILRTKTMIEVIEEHKSTAFYAFRFGGGLTITRDRNFTVPDVIDECENKYIQKYLAAVSEREDVSINTIEELGELFPMYMDSLKIQRERFYSAENLKVFSSDHLLQNDYFDDLTKDIYYGIYDLFEKKYSDGYARLVDTMTQVAQIDLQHNLLSKYNLVHPQDRQGICHQIANERNEVIWTNQSQVQKSV